MKHILVAPIGDNLDDIYVGIREFTAESIILITDKARKEKAQKFKEDLEKFKIPIQVKELPGNADIWEETFEAIAEINKQEKDSNILINVSSGDRDTRCAATAAAFVNGLKAFSVSNNETTLLPILKFSYYKILTDKKLAILRVLYENKDSQNKFCASLEELSKKTGMSLPLISYHINGTVKTNGLKELGLIGTVEKKGKIELQLSEMGKLLIKGYI